MIWKVYQHMFCVVFFFIFTYANFFFHLLGITFLFIKPPYAKKPDIRWRLYVFKGGEALNGKFRWFFFIWDVCFCEKWKIHKFFNLRFIS
jgi:hypothetical protein